MSRYKTTAERHEALKVMALKAADEAGIVLPQSFLREMALGFDVLVKEVRHQALKEGREEALGLASGEKTTEGKVENVEPSSGTGGTEE